jgi:hypothetical protein
MNRLAAVFVAKMAPHVIHENSAHHLRGDGEKVTAIVPVDLTLPKELDVRLVDDGGRFQAIVPPFVRELAGGERLELFVDDGDQSVEHLAAPGLPLAQDAGDLGEGRHVVHRAKTS